jgi:hypothetical protein
MDVSVDELPAHDQKQVGQLKIDPWQKSNSEDFLGCCHGLVKLFWQIYQGYPNNGVICTIRFLRPSYSTESSKQVTIFLVPDAKTDTCLDDADWGSEFWTTFRYRAIECAQRWGYWDREKFEAKWTDQAQQGIFHDTRLHRQHVVEVGDDSHARAPKDRIALSFLVEDIPQSIQPGEQTIQSRLMPMPGLGAGEL